MNGFQSWLKAFSLDAASSTKGHPLSLKLGTVYRQRCALFQSIKLYPTYMYFIIVLISTSADHWRQLCWHSAIWWLFYKLEVQGYVWSTSTSSLFDCLRLLISTPTTEKQVIEFPKWASCKLSRIFPTQLAIWLYPSLGLVKTLAMQTRTNLRTGQVACF